jgi:hypothetical protein
MALISVPFDSRWSWREGDLVQETYLGRPCVRSTDGAPVVAKLTGPELTDGAIEVDLLVGAERSFPGVAWRLNGNTYESFFIRPHQSGNPDSVQYTPVFNGVSAWQLYHGTGFWNPIELPIERWFTLRVAFAGDRAEAYIDDMDEPALVFGRLRVPPGPGHLGILPGGAGLRVARFAFDAARPALRGAPPPLEDLPYGTVPGWNVSNIVSEGVAPATVRTWTYLESERSGLANLARIHPLGTTLNTVFARTTLVTQSAGIRAMDLGFSDRAVVYLNGRPVYAGRDDYRSRDYRFLGSIGYWSTLFLPLAQGENELVVAVSESFGGWGLQARFADPTGITFKR